jgi:sarcosine oxidase
VYDVIVVGVGGMGSAAVYHLTSRGVRVLGLEQFDIPNDFGSSHGLSRIIRLPYWEHPQYVPLVQRSYALWQALERTADERLLIVTGSVDAGPDASPHMVGVRHACRTFGLTSEEFDAGTLSAKFPGYRLPSDCVAIYQPEGGFLLPERCIVAHVQAAQALGADVRGRETVLGWDSTPGGVRVRTTRSQYQAARLVLTAGAWTASVVPGIAAGLSPERQVVLWTQPIRPEYFRVGRFPVFYVEIAEGGFYGFPIHSVPGFKIGKYHHRRERVDPDTVDRRCHPEDEEVLRQGIRRGFPDANGPTMAMKTCLFTNTADEHFVIDVLEPQPRVVIAAGFSGHGFKFCSVVGEILADLALDGATRHDISLFAVDRVRRA